MADITRFVTYLYYYDGNQKLYNTGFAKVEVRENQCKLELHIKASLTPGTQIPVYLFARDGADIQAVEIGQMHAGQMSADFKIIFSSDQIGDSPYSMEDMKGILIMIDGQQMYASQWDDEPILRERIRIFQGEKRSLPVEQEQTSAAEETAPEFREENHEGASDAKEASGDAREQQAAIAVQNEVTEDAADETTQVIESMENRGNTQEETQGNKLKEADIVENDSQENDFPKLDESTRLWDTWEEMKAEKSVIRPVEGKNMLCVQMELNDFKNLPKKFWHYGNNSFLLNGFFNYRYVLFGEYETEDGRRLILGVPGVWRRQEKILAAIFGFPMFLTEKSDGDQFGYWCRIMDE